MTRAVTFAAALLAYAAAPAAAQPERCNYGESVGAGQGFRAFYLWACADHKVGGTRSYAQFFSGSHSTRATACQIWIRTEGNDARFYDCTPMLRIGRWRTYKYPITVDDKRTQACYRLRHGTGTWTRSYCALSR